MNVRRIITAVVISVLALHCLVAGYSLFLYSKFRPVSWNDWYLTAGLHSGLIDPSRSVLPWTVAVDWSADGKTLAIGGYFPDLLLWQPGQGSKVKRLSGHNCWVQEVIYSPDGRYLASSDWCGKVMIRDVASGAAISMAANKDVFSVSFHPSKPWLAAGGGDSTVWIFDRITGRELSHFKANEGGVLYLAFSPDGALLATGGEDHNIHIYDSITLEQKGKLVGHASDITSISFSSDSSTLFSSGDDSTVRKWDVSEQRQIAIWETKESWTSFVSLSPDDLSFFTAGADGKVRIWDVDQFVPVAELPLHKKWAQCVRVSPTGKRIASSDSSGLVRVWDLDNNQLAGTLKVGEVLNSR